MATQSLDNQIQEYWSLLGREEKQSLLSVMKCFVKLREDANAHKLPNIKDRNAKIEDEVNEL